MGSLDVDSQILSSSRLLDLPHDVVCQLLLKSTPSCAPLGDAGVFTEPDQFLSSQEADVGDSGDGLVVVAADGANLASNHEHAVVTILRIIGEGGGVGTFLVAADHDLVEVHLGEAFGSLLAVGVGLPVDEQYIENFLKGTDALDDEFLPIFLRDIVGNVVTGPESLPITFHTFSNGLRQGLLHQ